MTLGHFEEILILVGLIMALLECILLRRRVKRLEGDFERLSAITRDNRYFSKKVRQEFSMFANKQKYINNSLDRRIVEDRERAQKTKQSLSSLRRDFLLGGTFIKDE